MIQLYVAAVCQHQDPRRHVKCSKRRTARQTMATAPYLPQTFARNSSSLVGGFIVVYFVSDLKEPPKIEKLSMRSVSDKQYKRVRRRTLESTIIVDLRAHFWKP